MSKMSLLNVDDKSFEDLCKRHAERYIEEKDYSEENFELTFTPLLALANNSRQHYYLNATISMVLEPVRIVS